MVSQYPYTLQTRINGFDESIGSPIIGTWTDHSKCRDDRKYSERNYSGDTKDLYKGVKVFLPLGSNLPMLGINARVLDSSGFERIQGRVTSVHKTQLNIEITIDEQK